MGLRMLPRTIEVAAVEFAVTQLKDMGKYR